MMENYLLDSFLKKIPGNCFSPRSFPTGEVWGAVGFYFALSISAFHRVGGCRLRGSYWKKGKGLRSMESVLSSWLCPVLSLCDFIWIVISWQEKTSSWTDRKWLLCKIWGLVPMQRRTEQNESYTCPIETAENSRRGIVLSCNDSNNCSPFPPFFIKKKLSSILFSSYIITLYYDYMKLCHMKDYKVFASSKNYSTFYKTHG